MMSINFCKRIIKFIIWIPVIMLINCEKYLPEAYQQEEFTISDLDAEACRLFQDSLSDTISTSPLVDFDSSWVDSIIYENVEAVLDSLEANDIKVTDSVSYTIVTPEDMDTNYVFYWNDITDDGVVFFFDDYLNINIVGEDGIIINEESKAIPLETVNAYPELKTRIVYMLVEGRYLVHLVKIDLTLSDTIRAVILHNQ